MDDKRRPEHGDEHCAACGVELCDDEHGHPVCRTCDWQFNREPSAYLAFVAVCDGE